MKLIDSQRLLGDIQAKQSLFLFTAEDLGVLFSEKGETLRSTLKRLVSAKLLTKVASGIYAGDRIRDSKKDVLSLAAAKLRAGEVNYLSAESVLSNHSVISQQMLDRITVMTTGRSGTFKTPFGVIEFTHTKRNPIELLKTTRASPSMSIRVANVNLAYRDLKRIGRNLNMVNKEELNAVSESE